MTAAYQPNAYQNNAYQTAGIGLPAFQNDAFQFGAFQEAEPIPPEPSEYEGHDGGRRHRKHLKKLRELEEARIKAMREDAEHRKLMIRIAVDPQARAEYEAKLAEKVEKAEKPVEAAKQIQKIDKQIDKLVDLTQKLELKSIITSELARIHVQRKAYEAEIARQIQEADDEIALMMLM